MFFSLIGEIGLIVIGSLYVLDQWFDSFIHLIEVMKNDEDEEEAKKIPDAVKHLYS